MSPRPPRLSEKQIEDCDNDREIILKHLRRFRTITAEQGKKLYGIENTKGRISDLRRFQNIPIETLGGRPGVTATYRLVPKQEQQEEMFEKEEGEPA